MSENQQLDGLANGDLSEIEKELHQVDPKVFEGVNNKKRQQIIRTVVHTFQKVHVGPIPDPNTLAEYSRIIPNGAERIMAMAEKQAEHRIKLESSVVNSQMRQSNLGQILAFLIGIAALGAATYLGLNGAQWLGGAIGVGGITGLVTAFIQGRKSQDANLQEKNPRTKK